MISRYYYKQLFKSTDFNNNFIRSFSQQKCEEYPGSGDFMKIAAVILKWMNKVISAIHGLLMMINQFHVVITLGLLSMPYQRYIYNNHIEDNFNRSRLQVTLLSFFRLSQ